MIFGSSLMGRMLHPGTLAILGGFPKYSCFHFQNATILACGIARFGFRSAGRSTLAVGSLGAVLAQVVML